MTNAAAAPNPIAAATAIAQAARIRTEAATSAPGPRGPAAVLAMLTGVVLAVTAAVAMMLSPAVPIWCAAHGCPSPMAIPGTCTTQGSC